MAPKRKPQCGSRGVVKKKPAGAVGSRLPQSRCEHAAVGLAARKNYEKAYAEFESWLQEEGMSIPTTREEEEDALLQYLDHVLEEGRAAHFAELAVAAVVDRLCIVASTKELPRICRALKGYKKKTSWIALGEGGCGRSPAPKSPWPTSQATTPVWKALPSWEHRRSSSERPARGCVARRSRLPPTA